MTDLPDFDTYLRERGVSADDEEAVAALLADWLAQHSGGAIIGGPVGEPPAFVALPDDLLDRRARPVRAKPG